MVHAPRRARNGRTNDWYELCWLAGWLILFGSGCGQTPTEYESRTAQLSASGDAGATTAEPTATESKAPPADPFGLAGKNTRQLDAILAEVKPPGTTYYDLSPEDRAYFDALAKARARRFGRPPAVDRRPDRPTFPGVYANPAKNPNGPAPVEPIEPGEDLSTGGAP